MLLGRLYSKCASPTGPTRTGRGKNGSAILNNKVLAVNETIEGVRVISVGKQGVELEYQGKRRFIKVGISTN